MIGVLFLALATAAGFAAVKLWAPGVVRVPDHTPKVFLTVPLYFTLGVTFATWLAYLCCLAAAPTGNPMGLGLGLALGALLVFLAGVLWRKGPGFFVPQAPGPFPLPVVLGFAALAALALWLMCYTFFLREGDFYFGYTVYSDFGVHSALIRSFSRGANFPTQYPHFPDGTIRYHFLYQFLIGALEFMGLRLDLAFNLVSALCLINAAALLYVLALRLTGKPAVGVLTWGLFFFRSAMAFWRFAAEAAPTSLPDLAAKVWTADRFIGQTLHEDWGLYAVNVYANQRHFALGISALLLAVLCMGPLVGPAETASPPGANPKINAKIKQAWLSKAAWLPQSLPRAVLVGLLLGGASFINGAAVVAALALLGVLALFARGRLEFAAVAAIALGLAALEARFFAPGAVIAQPKLVLGYLAETPTLDGVVGFVGELTGFALPLAALGAGLAWRRLGPWALAFAAPFILAFVLALTPDIAINHKYIMIAVALLNIFAASAVVTLYEAGPRQWRAARAVVCGALVFVLTASGLVDWLSVKNLNGPDRSLVTPSESPLIRWIEENAPPGSVFLTDWHVIHPVYLAGRFEFFGWPYFAMGAGHDTYAREKIAQAMFSAASPEVLRLLAQENGISFILIDDTLRRDGFSGAPVNEWNIAATYPLVLEAGDVRIYQCQ